MLDLKTDLPQTFHGSPATAGAKKVLIVVPKGTTPFDGEQEAAIRRAYADKHAAFKDFGGTVEIVETAAKRKP